MTAHIRVSLRRLFLWISLYALLLGSFATFHATPLQIFAAVTTLTTFIFADSHFDWKSGSVPVRMQFAMLAAYYATAFAAVVAVSFAAYLLTPEPTPPPQPSSSLLGGIFYIVSGQLAADIGEAIGSEIARRLTYCVLFGAFSAIALSASLLAWRQFRAAKWFVLANSPGTCLLLLIVVVTIFEYLFGPPA